MWLRRRRETPTDAQSVGVIGHARTRVTVKGGLHRLDSLSVAVYRAVARDFWLKRLDTER